MKQADYLAIPEEKRGTYQHLRAAGVRRQDARQAVRDIQRQRMAVRQSHVKPTEGDLCTS